MKAQTLLLACLAILAGGSPSRCQESPKPFSTQGFWQPAAPPFSPQLHADRSVSFLLKAPKAQSVELLLGEWNVPRQAMQRDQTGTWSLTVPALEPGIHAYVFAVDGLRIADPANPVVKRGTELYGSIVEIPGDPPRFDQWQDVPHGSLETVHYTSTPLGRRRTMVVYLPPGYDPRGETRYPLLVLRHGGGDDETSWTQPSGRADVILDNLIARHEAVPMIVVMPNGLTDGSWAGGSSKDGMAALEAELMTDILPLAEGRYRLQPGRDQRAITGLSMGGGQAFLIGLRQLDHFAWIGQFSSGLLSDEAFDLNDRVPGILDDPAALNARLRLHWTGCGTDDPRLPGHRKLCDRLRERGVTLTQFDVPGGHEWKVWRTELHAFLPKLFR